MTQPPLAIALVQLAVEDGAPESNARGILAHLTSAPPAGLYLLPELVTTGYATATWDDAADRHTPAFLGELARLAATRAASIGLGTVSRNDDGRLVNRFWLLAPDGGRTWYDKAHLFPPFREPDLLAPGHAPGTGTVAGWPVALSTCFDLRFAGQYLQAARGGARLFLVASAWPAGRALAQETLARARAIEHQAYLALVNRTGTSEDGTVFGGGSMLVAPDGTVVAAGGAGEGVTLGTADAEVLAAVRAGYDIRSLELPGIDGA